MNRDAIQDLFDFTGWAWDQIAEAITHAGGDVLTSPAGGSGWPALRDCLGHIVLAYQRWCSGLPQRKTLAMDRFDPASINTFEELNGYRSAARAELRSFLDSVSDKELMKVQDFDIDGDTIRYSCAELLTHLLLHERGHHGDVTTLFYQMGLETPMLEYRFHLGRFDYD
ncbi:MAG TPA: DinB family protein [Dehalococcoidia bacterium]|nr:DinB family protein [Dehalococcoidia bacterium]